MLFSLLVFFQILSGLVAGESTIRQTSEGAKSIDTLSQAGLFFLKWRAYADYKKELRGLRNICGISALLFTVMLFAFGPGVRGSFINAVPGLFLVLWMMMQFGTNFKKSVQEQLQIIGIFVIGPWLVLGLDYITEFQMEQLRLLASPFNFLGIQALETYQIALVLSMFGGIGGVIVAITTIVLFSIVPLFLLFLMVTLSTFSKRALKISPKHAKNMALLYCFILGPVLMALESKGLL